MTPNPGSKSSKVNSDTENTALNETLTSLQNPSNDIITDIPAATTSKRPFSKYKEKPKLTFVPEKAKESKPMYRDRAAERRQGLNPDYQDAETLLSVLRTAVPADDVPLDTRFLGGDKHYTHLVKGLDVSLLRQEQLRIMKDARATERPGVEAARPGGKLTPFLRTLLEAALKKPAPPPLSNPHCYPGRMAFVFQPNGTFTVVLRSTDQVSDVAREQVAVINKVLSLLHPKDGAAAAAMVTKKRGVPPSTPALLSTKEEQGNQLGTSVEKAVPNPEPARIQEAEDDVDIFEDAGHDYALNIDVNAAKSLTVDAEPQSVFNRSPHSGSEEGEIPTSMKEFLATVPDLIQSSNPPPPALSQSERLSKSKRAFEKDLADAMDLDKDDLLWTGQHEFVEHVVSDLDDEDAEEGEEGPDARDDQATLAQLEDLKQEVRWTLDSLDQKAKQRTHRQQGEVGEEEEHVKKRPYSHSNLSHPTRPKKKKFEQLSAYMQAKYGSTPFHPSSSASSGHEK